jgi:hypothetical protein
MVVIFQKLTVTACTGLNEERQRAVYGLVVGKTIRQLLPLKVDFEQAIST